MNPRSTVILALIVVELAIIGEAFVALHPGRPGAAFAQGGEAQTASGGHLVEGGPHQVFDAGAHPAISVDIGYADLTILTSKTAHIDVSLGAGSSGGFFPATVPIAASEDNDTIRIATTKQQRWSTGDDRMVTVVVPPETEVTVINAGDIKASGLRAEASLNSIGTGSITVEDYEGPALHVTASDGRISMRQIVATRVEATSSDGRVVGTGLQVRDGTVESDGSVTLGFAAGSDTLVNAQTDDGKVRLSGFDAAKTGATEHKNDDGDDDSASQTVRVGASDGHFDVHSSDGNINLAQEG